MTREEHAAVNQAAVLQLKPGIDADFPANQFVAIAAGKIVADDVDFVRLKALGIDPINALIDRAGEDTTGELITL
jgi:hypothetical protein